MCLFTSHEAEGVTSPPPQQHQQTRAKLIFLTSRVEPWRLSSASTPAPELSVPADRMIRHGSHGSHGHQNSRSIPSSSLDVASASTALDRVLGLLDGFEVCIPDSSSPTHLSPTPRGAGPAGVSAQKRVRVDGGDDRDRPPGQRRPTRVPDSTSAASRELGRVLTLRLPRAPSRARRTPRMPVLLVERAWHECEV